VVANDVETKRWNDDRWTSVWPERERLTGAVSPFLLSHVSPEPGQRLLDIGTGGGELAIALAELVQPDGLVVGVDLSLALLGLARRRAAEAGANNVSLVRADAQTDSVGGAPFDGAVSQFGVMFFDEPIVAFSNIRVHLRPGGRFVFAAWQAVECNPWHLGTALRSVVPPPPPPATGKNVTGPFTLGDVGHTSRLLEGAGYSGVSCTSFDTAVRAPASAIVDLSLLDFMGVSPERRQEATRLIELHLNRFRVSTTDEFDFPLAFNVFEATNASPGGT
jgi:SAM-dependent methyltransferase